MYIDVVDLRTFYSDALGTIARRLISERLKRHWPSLDSSQCVLGIGYATPYLNGLAPNGERVLAFMPAAQGVVHWPLDSPNRTALVEEGCLPLPDACVDRVLVVHSLEMVDNPGEQLREIWRVLTPAGRLIAVVPNRAGIWARSESTPFGYGRPFGRSQLAALLRHTSFAPVAWSEVLAFPPFRFRPILRSGVSWERAGRLLWPTFSGVLVVEASKHVHDPAVAPVRRRRIRGVFQPAPASPA